MRFKTTKQGEYYYVLDTLTDFVCSDPFVDRKTANKYARIANNLEAIGLEPVTA